MVRVFIALGATLVAFLVLRYSVFGYQLLAGIASIAKAFLIEATIKP